jgi:hypothetical protein
MLTLTLLPEAGPLVLPEAGSPGVEVWRDLSGVVCLLGERAQARLRLHVVGLATYEFGFDGPEVRAWPRPGASRRLVVDQFYRTVLPLALQARGREVLHASAVRAPRGVMAFCAAKTHGKSTLAFALGRRGFEPWADDAVVFEPDGASGVTVLSVPFALRLRPEASAHFDVPHGALGGDRREDEPIRLEPAPLAAVFVVRREPAGAFGSAPPVALRCLEAGAAFRAVLENAYSFSLAEPDRKMRLVERYLHLVANVPVFELRYENGLGHLPVVLATIESVFETLGDRTPPVAG